MFYLLKHRIFHFKITKNISKKKIRLKLQFLMGVHVIRDLVWLMIICIGLSKKQNHINKMELKQKMFICTDKKKTLRQLGIS